MDRKPKNIMLKTYDYSVMFYFSSDVLTLRVSSSVIWPLQRIGIWHFEAVTGTIIIISRSSWRLFCFLRPYCAGLHSYQSALQAYHYLPTVILIIIGIPSPTHSLTLGLNPSFSANPPYLSLSFFSFRIHYMNFLDCLLLLLSISVFLLFSFSVFFHFLVVGSVR